LLIEIELNSVVQAGYSSFLNMRIKGFAHMIERDQLSLISNVTMHSFSQKIDIYGTCIHLLLNRYKDRNESRVLR